MGGKGLKYCLILNDESHCMIIQYEYHCTYLTVYNMWFDSKL